MYYCDDEIVCIEIQRVSEIFVEKTLDFCPVTVEKTQGIVQFGEI